MYFILRFELNDFRTASSQIAEFWPTSHAMPQSMLGKLVLMFYLLYSRTFEVPGYEVQFLQSQSPSVPPM
jgi:hypothetical protein